MRTERGMGHHARLLSHALPAGVICRLRLSQVSRPAVPRLGHLFRNKFNGTNPKCPTVPVYRRGTVGHLAEQQAKRWMAGDGR